MALVSESTIEAAKRLCEERDSEIQPGLYTLEEARAELARENCRRWGHSWEVLSNMLRPFKIVCECGASYVVVTPDEANRLIES